MIKKAHNKVWARSGYLQAETDFKAMLSAELAC